MKDKAQILKGILEACVLKIISKEVTYGYELLNKLRRSGFDDMVEGTLYPLLLRLEKNELIKTEKGESKEGRPRKYFYLTSKGEEYLSNFEIYWDKLSRDVNKIIKE